MPMFRRRAVFLAFCSFLVGVDVEETRKAGCLGGLLGLLGEKHGVDVGEDTAGGDGDAAEELVELLIVADGELDVARDDALLLVVARGVARELEDLSREVLEDGGEVDRGTGTDASGVPANAEVAVDAANRELEAGLSRAGGGLARFLSTSHC